jgi:hypothetical protein
LTIDLTFCRHHVERLTTFLLCIAHVFVLLFETKLSVYKIRRKRGGNVELFRLHTLNPRYIVSAVDLASAPAPEKVAVARVGKEITEFRLG